VGTGESRHHSDKWFFSVEQDRLGRSDKRRKGVAKEEEKRRNEEGRRDIEQGRH
jgi:hypothetical protein